MENLNSGVKVKPKGVHKKNWSEIDERLIGKKRSVSFGRRTHPLGAVNAPYGALHTSTKSRSYEQTRGWYTARRLRSGMIAHESSMIPHASSSIESIAVICVVVCGHFEVSLGQLRGFLHLVNPFRPLLNTFPSLSFRCGSGVTLVARCISYGRRGVRVRAACR